MATGTAGGYGRDDRTVVGFGTDEETEDLGFRITTVGIENGDALGTETRWVGGVFLIATRDYLAVVEKGGGSYTKAGIGGIGSGGGCAGLAEEFFGLGGVGGLRCRYGGYAYAYVYLMFFHGFDVLCFRGDGLDSTGARVLL